jgi:UDP-N-acetylglucosamine--N-acetylmuramyl-(pentapeptide) pyrophosphoryl-undecaprenol N-acetylglucosamine transferase
LKFLFAAGGSGGHVEPALATAEVLLRLQSGIEIYFVSSAGGVGEGLVRSRGFEVVAINAVPAPREFSREIVNAPMALWGAVGDVLGVIEVLRPRVLVGFGGYVSAPAYLAAKRKGVPFVVHEANARAGWANRLGARLTKFRAENYPGSLANAEVVGMPIRQSLVELDRAQLRTQARRQFGFTSDRLTLLVTGGSQGAKKLNQVVFEAHETLSELGIDVLHILGEAHVGTAPPANDFYRPVGFVADMRMAYSAADFICCRAGANTVAEVGLVGLPALFVPLPIGNGEQRLNALPLAEAGVAQIIQNDDFSASALVAWVKGLTGAKGMNGDQRHAVPEWAGPSDLVIRDGSQRLARLVLQAADLLVTA